MYPNSIIGYGLTVVSIKYFGAKVYTIRVHGPLQIVVSAMTCESRTTRTTKVKDTAPVNRLQPSAEC